MIYRAILLTESQYNSLGCLIDLAELKDSAPEVIFSAIQEFNSTRPLSESEAQKVRVILKSS